MSVDIAAQKFLDNFLKLQVEAQDNAPIDHEKVTVLDFHITENVIVTRTREPRFYGGTIGRGDRQRPVWVTCMKQAKAISGDLIHLYEEKLGEELIPLWPYAR